MGIQVKVTGDPRRPQDCVDYERAKPTADEEASTDLMLIASIVLGVLGMLFKVKLAAWTAIFVCLSGVANLPSRNYDSKNLTYAAMFCLFGLVGSYVKPPPAGPTAAPAPK